MNDRSQPLDRRLDRRIPLGCNAAIRLESGEILPAECVELSVGGMTVKAKYVPGESEMVEIAVTSPGGAPPLVAMVEVRRCHACGDGRYEIGGSIVRVVE